MHIEYFVYKRIVGKLSNTNKPKSSIKELFNGTLTVNKKLNVSIDIN